MGLIQEEIANNDLGVNLTIDSHARNETREPFDIISLEFDRTYGLTPEALQALGVWLIAQADRIRNQYTQTGKRKSKKAA